MAECLVFITDKVNPHSARMNAECPKRGDIITVQDDGWPWSPAERVFPFSVVQVPGVDAADLSAFLAPEPDDADKPGKKLLQFRAFKFDIDDWEAKGKPKLARGQILAMKKGRPPLADPDVLA
jgi:hypothetical protein